MSKIYSLILFFICAIVLKFIISRYIKNSMIRNKGKKGEVNIVRSLKRFPGYKKILKNVYIPKVGGGTTEIDAIMIHEKGIVVLESKNYSGWIYGNSSQMWTQAFPNGKKYQFYNPIMQNNGHINHLSKYLKNVPFSTYKSVIVFGKASKLKKVKSSDGVLVVNYKFLRRKLKRFVSFRPVLSKNDVDVIYLSLKKHTRVSLKTKKNHIKNVNKQIKKG